MDNRKFEEGIDFFAQLFGSFLELRKMGYTQEEINWAYNKHDEWKFCAKF